jgi:hypothetical protein
MSTTHQDKSMGKPRQHGRKATRRNQKSDQPQSPKPDQLDEQQIGALVASTDVPTDDAAASAELPPAPTDMPLIGEVLPPDAPPIEAVARADNWSISIQTIANAYGDYAKKSFRETTSFVEKLMGVRSFDMAIEVQTEFARQAYANFVADSQKIFELYSELAKQLFRPWQGPAANMTEAAR